MIDPLQTYLEARDRCGLTNSAVARISSENGEHLDSKSLDHWCKNGTGKTSWTLVVRALAVVGVEVSLKPVKGFKPPTVRPAGRPKRSEVQG